MVSPSDFVKQFGAPSPVRHQSQYVAHGKIGGRILWRDQFEMNTVMLFGAVLQLGWAIVFRSNARLAAAPTLLLALYKLLAFGFRLRTHAALRARGEYPAGILPGMYMSVIPREDGEGRSDICAIVLAATCSHPLGLLAPGLQDLGNRFSKYGKILDENREEYDYLGGTSWVGTGSSTANRIMTIHYFRSSEGLTKFALKGAHTEAMTWWSKVDYPHLGISHELFSVPANNWEAIYHNMEPWGLGATSFKMPDGTWRRSLVDINGRTLTSMKRRQVEADLIKDEY